MQAWTCWRLDGGGIGPPVPAAHRIICRAKPTGAAPKSPVGKFSPIQAGAQPRNAMLQHEAEAPTAPRRSSC